MVSGLSIITEPELKTDNRLKTERSGQSAVGEDVIDAMKAVLRDRGFRLGLVFGL
jgi:hypothetical protein